MASNNYASTISKRSADSTIIDPAAAPSSPDGERKGRGRPKKSSKLSGAASIATKLKKTGLAGSFANTPSTLKAVFGDASVETLETLDGAAWEEAQQRGLQLRPFGYVGQRLNMSMRLTPKAMPLVTPVLKLPPPWLPASHALGTRDWQAIAAHVSASVGRALGISRAEVLLVTWVAQSAIPVNLSR